MLLGVSLQSKTHKIWTLLRDGGIALASALVAIWTLTPEFGLWVTVASLLLGVFMAGLLEWEVRNELNERPLRAFRFTAALVFFAGGGAVLCLAIIFASFAIEGGFVWVVRFASAIQQLPSKAWIVLGGATSTAAVGALFFLFRLKLRFVYGFTEALAGIAIAGQRISVQPGTSIPSETEFYIAVLTAGVYLVVRGLDNMHQAARDGDPVFAWVRRVLRRSGRNQSTSSTGN